MKSRATLRTFGLVFVLLPAAISLDAQGQATNALTCDTDVEVDTPVEAAFAEYYYCLSPLFEAWTKEYPNEVAQLEGMYRRWREARVHDLRRRPEAARWARQYPIDFTWSEVQLTADEVRRLAPSGNGAKAVVPGVFQRLFVDRDNDRLFLTSATQGLVSIDISRRYDFQLEGSAGAGGAKDFFVVDENTAFVEETVSGGRDRDLVVLDISDRSRPREVARVRGAIPAVGAPPTHRALAESPPSFEDFVLLHEGRLVTPECRLPQAAWGRSAVHCRTDGTCYRRERESEPNEGFCLREIPDRQWRGRAWPREIGRSAGPDDFNAELFSGARAGRMASATPGGEGGAGSLSQMMMHGDVLYVLSGSEGRPEGWLVTFDVTEPRQPKLTQLVRLDNGPEALRRHDTLLLIAGRDAMITASLANAKHPRLLGEYRQECPVRRDPVVVRGSIAYRTIIVDRPGTTCSSRLEVIDLSQPHAPILREFQSLLRPRGLSVLGERLFVADESVGIRVFNIMNPVSPVPAGVLELPGVQDLVLSGLDLYALTPKQIETYFVGPLFEREVGASAGLARVRGHTTVECLGDCTPPRAPTHRHSFAPSPPRPGAGNFPREISRGDIMQVVSSRRHELRECVRRQREAAPDASGVVAMAWKIAPDGTVQDLRLKTLEHEDTVMHACLRDVIGRMTFPLYEGPQMAEIEFPFQF